MVDAGGKGLFYLFEGMLRFLEGQPLESAEISVKPLSAINLNNALEKIEPGQDFEWVIDFRPYENLDSIKIL